MAVIGAGAAGLISARKLLLKGYNPTVFEESDHVGGIWETGSKTSESPIYKLLETNVPKQCMVFEDDEYPESFKTFLTQKDVIKYLRSFCSKRELDKVIKFRHQVTHVCKDQELNKWMVKTKVLGGPTNGKVDETEWEFDAVFICSGLFRRPAPWKVEGHANLEKNGIHVEHSSDYRVPHQSRYVDRNLIVIGAGPSGTDIALQLCDTAKKVYLSHSMGKSMVPVNRPDNLEEIGRIGRVDANGEIELLDGQIVKEVTCIVACNGYVLDYDFLECEREVCEISEDGYTMFGLLKHSVSINDPTLVFIGIPIKAIPFPAFEYQATFAVAVLERRLIGRQRFAELVENEAREMEAFKREALRHGAHNWWKKWHVDTAKGFELIEDLAELSGSESYPASVAELTMFCVRSRLNDPAGFRRMVLTKHGPDSGMWSATKMVGGEEVTISTEL